MKAHVVLAKNLKLLFRARESAFTIIFGPLLIILLVSAAYTGGGDSLIRVGTAAPSYTPLADQIITSLKEGGYVVSVLSGEEACLAMIEEGDLHACIIFPPDFRVKENGTNLVTIAVDNSRLGLASQIRERLGREFDARSAEISEGLAADMLERLSVAQGEVSEQVGVARELEGLRSRSAGEAARARRALEGVETGLNVTDLAGVRGSVTGLGSTITELFDESVAALDEAGELLRTVKRRCDNCSEETELFIDEGLASLDEARVRLEEITEDTPERVREATMVIEDAARSISSMRDRFGRLVNASEEAAALLREAERLLDEQLSLLVTLEGKLRHVDATLREGLGLSAEGLSSPIVTRTVPVSTDQRKLAFTYPYLLLLVIMFLGLMLNSSLVVMEKTSRAAFRNFTTATRDEYHVFLSFVTTFFILLVQVLLILLASYFFIGERLFNNFGVSLVIIVAAITLFSFLGMIIGYLVGTAEAAMISSLSLGSILLFISNLVLPIESMNALVQALSAYNPYVVLSELLRQSMLFNLRLGEVAGRIAVLALFLLALFLVILGVQRSFKRRFFQRRSRDLASSSFAPRARSVKPLLLPRREVRDLFDLFDALDAMTRVEFSRVVSREKNPIAEWVLRELGEKRLARKLRTPSKERMILALDHYLKKKSRELSRR